MSTRVYVVGDLSTLEHHDLLFDGAVLRCDTVEDVRQLGMLLYQPVHVVAFASRAGLARLRELVERTRAAEGRLAAPGGSDFDRVVMVALASVREEVELALAELSGDRSGGER